MTTDLAFPWTLGYSVRQVETLLSENVAPVAMGEDELPEANQQLVDIRCRHKGQVANEDGHDIC